jgi:hypothetical protein
MPAIAEDYNNYCAFTLTAESLGPLRVWWFKAEKIVWEVIKRFRKFDSASDSDFMMVFVSTAAKHLNLEREKREGEPITAEEANKLTDDELELIAGETIKHHIYLFEDRGETVYEQGVSEKGEELTGVSPSKLDIPKEESESNVHYLRRLILLLSEREKLERERSLEVLSKSVSKWNDVSLGFPNKLSESLSRMNSYVIAPPTNPQHTTNQKLEDVLEVLAGQKELNEQMVRAIEKNSGESSRQVKISNTIAFLALLIALLTLLYTYFSNQRPINQVSPPQVTAPASPESPQGEMK